MSVHQRIARLPYGYIATFRFSEDLGIAIGWEPDRPRLRSARAQRRFFDAYIAERDAFLKDVATMIGGTIVMADIGGPLGGITTIKPAARN